MKRPLVLALNPSIDAEWHVDSVRWEEKNNVISEHRWAGGKGVNVARWLTYFGAKPLILLPLGGATGKELAQGLKRQGIAARTVPIQEETRVNVIVTTRGQGQIRFNPLGPKLHASEWMRLNSTLKSSLRQASCLILSGSLPRGLTASTYASLIKLARQVDVPVFLDCDGESLVRAVKARPFMVKPNEDELLAWAVAAGLKIGRREHDIRRLALDLSSVTKHWVLVSRGARAGWLVNARINYALRAAPPLTKPRTTVGAGDALLAGTVASVLRAEAYEDWLQSGLATGSAATQSAAGSLPGKHEAISPN